MADELVAIVGKGSMAAAVGGALKRVGQAFYFIDRSGPVNWTYTLDDGTSSVKIFAVVPPAWQVKTSLIFLCVKAYDLAGAFDHLALFDEWLVAVPLANGAVDGMVAAAGRKYSHHTFRAGFSTVGCTRSGPDAFSSRSTSGRFQFGPGSSGMDKTTTEEGITGAKSLFVWNASIDVYQRRKWIFNTVLNSITAARRYGSNGQVLEDLSYLSAVFEEAYLLSVELSGDFPVSRQELYESMLKLIKDTENNENSMAADIRLGRKTETDFLAGLALKHPDKYPLLVTMHRKILGMSGQISV